MINFLEALVVIILYLVGVTHVYNMNDVNLKSKILVFVFMTCVFFLYLRQQISGAAVNKDKSTFSNQKIKIIAYASLVLFILVLVFISIEFKYEGKITYFPLKILVGVIFYRVFKINFYQLTRK